jgi:parallel beta-helix repeat protein
MTWNRLVAIRRVRLALPLSVAICITLLWASPAKAGTTITQSACPILITQAGDYRLATDVGPCPLGVDGIDILASGVTLHLQGHTITGTCTSGIGIRVLGTPLVPLTMVRILGTGTVSTFPTGFQADNSGGSFVKFVTVASTCFMGNGFYITPTSSQWKLDGNVVQAPSTSYGIILRGSDNDLVRNNVSDTISVDSDNNVIVNNTASGDGGGIFVESSNNDIHANTTNDNVSSNGIWVFLGSGNNITGNTAQNNVPFDLDDDNPNCGTNKWEGNKFGSANQSCIQ